MNFLNISKFKLNENDCSWKNFFESELTKKYFFELLTFLEKEYQEYICWPEIENIFRLFRETSLRGIKVVILGQDPYHTSGLADGLAFSSKKEHFIPASLKNIFLELSTDLACPLPKKGNLLPWVKEGVFLLNTTLTVRDKQPLSHEKLWKRFSYSLIKYIKSHDKHIIWVFLGRKAQMQREHCDIDIKHSVLTSHPSPYSANYGFFNSKIFSRVNRLLISHNKKKIDWTRSMY